MRKSGAVGMTYFAYGPGGALLAENVNGAWVDYVWLNGRLIGRLANGQTYAIHADQTGRPETVTDASRTVVWQAQNLAFTRNVTKANITLNIGFPGQYYDAETDKWNNGYRDYDARLGRYVESDPIGLMGGVNTYAYAGGSPISFVDPLGLCNCNIEVPPAPPGADYNRNISLAQGINSSGISPFGMMLFADLVRPGGSWDYKTGGYPRFEAAGNFNYGATGRAAGFSRSFLLKMAGVVQIAVGRSSPQYGNPFSGSPYGDDPSDQKQIAQGMDYYDQCFN